MVPKTCSIPECSETLPARNRTGMCKFHHQQNRPECSIEGCTNKRRGRGFCSTHWMRWRNHGDPNYVTPRVPVFVKCKFPSCDKQKHAHDYCDFHLYRYERYGDPAADGPGRSAGRNRLEAPSYDGMHKRLFYDRGKASQFACADCDNPAEEWSYDGGCPDELYGVKGATTLAYSTDQGRYSPRCKRCHRAKDESLNRGRDQAGRWAPWPKDRDATGQ